MKLNDNALYLSLITAALDTTLAPELRSSNAKAVADVIRLSLAELRRRAGQAPALLAAANHAGRALLSEAAALLGPGHASGGAACLAGAAETATGRASFTAEAAQNEVLTQQLAAASRQLARSSDAHSRDHVNQFLRRAAEWEYRLHADLSTASPSRNAPDAEPDPLPHAALEAFLRRHDDAYRVRERIRVEGGYGKQTYLVRVDHSQQSREFVVRKADRVMSVALGAFIIEREFQLLSAVAATGFPAPRPLWFGARDAAIDGDFFVMERLDGKVPGSLLDGAAQIPETYLLDLAEQLARLHRFGLEPFTAYIERYEPASLLEETIEQCYRRSIGVWRRHVIDVTQTPSPLMEYLFSWLEQNVPRHTAKPVLIHGDFNIHNVLMSSDGRLSGVLDWECAMFGAPEQDLAYIKPHVSRHIDWDRFIAHYLAAGGRPLDESSLNFYQAFSAMRVINGLQWFTKKLQNGESSEIRLCMAELGFAAPFMRFALDHVQD